MNKGHGAVLWHGVCVAVQGPGFDQCVHVCVCVFVCVGAYTYTHIDRHKEKARTNEE